MSPRKFILRRATIARSVYSIFNSGGKAKLTFLNGPRTVAGKAPGPISAPTRFSAGKDDSMTIAVGDQIPDVKLMKATESGPEAVQTADYFKGKRVALFSVPGAFTPT